MVKGIYTPKYHQDKLYFNIFKNHWEKFVQIYPERFRDEYGKLEDYQRDIVEKFTKCGDPEEGFAYLECPKCGESYIVPFSCKSRVCNSCGEKKALIWSAWVATEVLLNCNHRHLTFTIPIALRRYFYKSKGLLKKYLESACDLANYIATLNCPNKTAKPGIIAVLQTSGSSLNFNPHIHLILTEGLIGFPQEMDDSSYDDFHTYPLPKVNFRHINLLWRNKVLKLLCNFKIIDKDKIKEFQRIYSNGFNVNVRYKTTYDNNEEKERIAKYLMHQPIGENRIEYYNEEDEKVTIRFRTEINPETGKGIYKIENMDPYEFIARRIQHIMPHHMQVVRFYGLYSNKYRGQHKKLTKTLNPQSENIPKSKFRVPWRELIWKIYEADPLKCTNCGTEMKIKKIYTQREAPDSLIALTELKYYISGRWRIERRHYYIGAQDGWECRKKAC